MSRSVFLLWVADRRGCGSVRIRREDDGSLLDGLSTARLARLLGYNVSVLYCNRPGWQLGMTHDMYVWFWFRKLEAELKGLLFCDYFKKSSFSVA